MTFSPEDWDEICARIFPRRNPVDTRGNISSSSTGLTSENISNLCINVNNIGDKVTSVSSTFYLLKHRGQFWSWHVKNATLSSSVVSSIVMLWRFLLWHINRHQTDFGGSDVLYILVPIYNDFYSYLLMIDCQSINQSINHVCPLSEFPCLLLFYKSVKSSIKSIFKKKV